MLPPEKTGQLQRWLHRAQKKTKQKKKQEREKKNMLSVWDVFKTKMKKKRGVGISTSNWVCLELTSAGHGEREAAAADSIRLEVEVLQSLCAFQCDTPQPNTRTVHCLFGNVSVAMGRSGTATP